MRKEKPADTARRVLIEGALWVGALTLLGILVGAFVFVFVVVNSSQPVRAQSAADAAPEGHTPALSDLAVPGLIGRYFDCGGMLDDFPPVDARKPTLVRIDPQVDFAASEGPFAGTRLRDHFYVEWTGILRVPRDGRYVFYVESDDGSRLWIDGAEVVRNGGLHAMSEKRGEVELAAGDHEIRLDYFEASSSAGCRLSWEAEGRPKEAIPAPALFHRPAHR